MKVSGGLTLGGALQRRRRAIVARRRIAAEWDAVHEEEPNDPKRFSAGYPAKPRWRETHRDRGSRRVVEELCLAVRAGRLAADVSTWSALGELVSFWMQRRRLEDTVLQCTRCPSRSVHDSLGGEKPVDGAELVVA